MTKICSRCKEEKQLEEFYRNRQGKMGDTPSVKFVEGLQAGSGSKKT
ncbi:hypothetical protein P5775_21105 [Bacillus cereus]|nr:hypothetical protein [Bacillus cereus]MDF9625229.1 hypothetical protein [Bacillus cereus]MEB9551586.1 hypothetical protein [Bacillus cereus]MEB9568562.1 hypothetical protein [Bacillus cereus]